MREIKFRAWDKTTCVMINEYAHVGMYGELYPSRFPSSAYSSKGCPELVLMQFTGLLDKNGREIFEGDVLESPNDPGETLRHIVEWSDKFCGWFARNVTDKTPERRDGSIQLWVYKGSAQYGEFVVIGNIHEHPELAGGLGE